MATTQDEFKKEKIGSYRSLVSAIKRQWKSLPSELAVKLVHSMNNRISEVTKSHSDFIFH